MGEKTTNFNIDELLTSYIDKQIHDPATLNKVEGLISSDDTVQKKYKSELLTKSLLGSRLCMADVPERTSARIGFALDEMYSSAMNKSEVETHPLAVSTSFPDYFMKFMATPMRVANLPVPRYAFAVFLIVVSVSVGLYVNNMSGSTPTNAHLMTGSDKNIVKQAIDNFHKIINGDIKPQKLPQNAKEIGTYLSERSDFPVYVPDIKEYKLSGVICDEYNGQKLCHLIYSSGDDVIYIYQTQSKCIERKDLEIPDEVRSEIKTNRYFMCDEVDPQNCTVTIWYKDNNVCASVTNLPKQKMNNTFASFK